LVYVFFTSGTTGKPKGVMVEHGGLAHRIDWFQREWPLQRGQAIMLKHSYTFGLSEWEIFWPLSSGATLVLPPPGSEKDPEYILSRTCGRNGEPGSGFAAWPPMPYHVFVPSMLQMFLDHVAELEDLARAKGDAAKGEEEAWWRSAALREVIVCSEPLTPALAQRLFAMFPRTQLTNLYGPTEGEMTAWRCPKGRAVSRVPVGKPMAGSKVVLAGLYERTPAASLEPAELSFGGPFIARGYLGQADLTSAAFVPDFTVTQTPQVQASAKQRLYLTGDLGRWQPDGNVELLGRRDFQVKLRGFRIELGEVEAALRAAGAREAVALVRPGPSGALALAAYWAPESLAPTAAVRTACEQRLPTYMRPTVLVPCDALPRNANGKIDRKALPDPTAALPNNGAESAEEAALASEVERAVADVWAEILKMDSKKVPPDTDFNALGGSSLLAGRATALIRRKLAVPTLPGTAIYRHNTVRRLATAVEVLLPTACAASPVADASAPSRAASVALVLKGQEQRLSAANPLVLLAQSLGIMVLNMVHEPEAWSPVYWGLFYAYYLYGQWAIIALLPVAFVLDHIFQIVLIVMLKWTICGKLQPGTSPLWGGRYLRWWFGHQLLETALPHITPLVAETSLLPALYRLLGARIGHDVQLGTEPILEPDLVIIGDGAVVSRQVHVFGSTCAAGSLHLRHACVGRGAVVQPCAVVTPGSVVPAGASVGALSSSQGWLPLEVQSEAAAIAAAVGREERSPAPSASEERIQDRLRVFVGVPILVLLHTLPLVPLIFLLEWGWKVTERHFGANAYMAFFVLLPWVYSLTTSFGYTALVILQKRLVVGRLAPGSKSAGPGHASALKRWLHARAMESPQFRDAADQFVNTEVLCLIYRLLGAKVGRRVQIDVINTAEHDCITIEDYVLFGSKVAINGSAPPKPRPQAELTSPGAKDASERSNESLLAPTFEEVRLLRGANVLDHSCLLPGVIVGEKAILGTHSLGQQGGYFPPTSVSTGSVGGRAVTLREAHLSVPKQLELEHEAMRTLDSARWWHFNFALVSFALLVKPLPEALWVLTYYAVVSVWGIDEERPWSILLIVPFVHLFIDVIELMLSITLKWMIVGTYRTGAFPFFSLLHLRWAMMMQLRGAMSGLNESLQGTAFNNWALRAYGASVGRDCCLFGLALEYDLLSVGDRVAIGAGSDTTCHTVENMLLTLAPTRIADDASMLNASFAMPGASIEANSMILENSQVLKGETVPQGEIWAGLPAAKLQ
jgi:acetyltransferase-like isoleucine patch superfamily enzyme